MAKRKNPHAVALGRKGGISRLYTISPERRREIARLGGLATARNRKAKAAPPNQFPVV